MEMGVTRESQWGQLPLGTKEDRQPWGWGGWETVGGGGFWGSPEMEMRLGLGGAQKGRKQN